MAQANPWDAFPVAPAAPAAGPLPSPPERPKEPKEPKTSWRMLTPEEAKGRGYDSTQSFQISSEGKVEPVPGTKPTRALREGDTNKLATMGDTLDTMQGLLGSFNDAYAGNTITGGLENDIQSKVSSFGTPGQRDWWSNMANIDNQIRNGQFGASLTPGEKAEFEKTTIDPSMDPKIIRENLGRRADILHRAAARRVLALKAGGWNAEEIDALVGAQLEAAGVDAPPVDDKEPPASATAPAGAVPGAPPPSGTPPPLSPGDPGYQAVTGNTKTVSDPETQSAVDKMLREGRPYAEVNAFAQSRGMAPMNPQEYEAVRAFIAKNPNYNGSLVNASKYEPVSTYEKRVTGLGDSAAGNYLLHAGQFLTGNTLDNISGDPERARLAMSIGDAQHSTAGAIGDVTGGVIGSLLGEAGVARMGVGGGLARGLGVDVATGAANGAGAADYSGNGTPSTLGDRLLGAGKGGVVAGVGSAAGSGASKGLSAAFNPMGGRLGELYEAGVRPSIGQRAAAAEGPISGPVGKVVNAAEEALQSVPVVGSMIRGTREAARDQFQVGAFNQALAEIGEELPKGAKPGTALHATAQKAFNDAYDKARAGMTLATDEELSNELGALGPDIETLGPELQKRLKLIMDNTVNNRLDANGQMSGDAFKKVVSVLDKRIASRRKSTIADDQDFADILEGVKTAIENAARRHSDPEAVALLDAADAGYAKLVRIEEAAARRGGDDGTFSPSQFSSAVQKGSGGVRSKAFLRGDALMQDYAGAGKALTDKLPNSGTADRVMAGYAVGAPVAGTAAYFSPLAATVLGAIGIANAPGVRKIVTGAMAPSKNATAKAISEQLSKRARLVGRTTAAIGAAHELGTSPGQ